MRPKIRKWGLTMKKGTLTPNNWNARLRGVFGCIHINIDRYWWEGDHQPGYWGTVPHFQTNKLPYYDWVGRAMKYFSWRMPQKNLHGPARFWLVTAVGCLCRCQHWPQQTLRRTSNFCVESALLSLCPANITWPFRAPTKYWAATAQELPRRPAHGGPKRIPKHWAADSWCAQLVDRANRSGWACRTSGCEPWVILAKFALKRDGKSDASWSKPKSQALIHGIWPWILNEINKTCQCSKMKSPCFLGCSSLSFRNYNFGMGQQLSKTWCPELPQCSFFLEKLPLVGITYHRMRVISKLGVPQITNKLDDVGAPML